MHHYSIHITWREDDQSFTAIVPELVGCTAAGATHEAALAAIHPAIDAWIESARAAGHPIPEPEGAASDPKKGRGGRRQQRIEKRRRQREEGRRQRRESD